MEPLGLAVGVAGLAGLFSSCLEAVDKVQSYQTFGTDSRVLDTRFKAAKTRFERWGLGVGIKQGKLLPTHHPFLDDHDISAVVTDLLHIIIKAICDASNSPQHRDRATGLDVDDSSGLHEPGLPFAAASRSRRGKMSWALWGKRGRVEKVELFEKLVQQLHYLVPLTAWESTQPTHKPDPGRSDTPEQGTPGHTWPADIRHILARIEGELRAETRRELHLWLGHSLNERYHDSLEKRLNGTCNWILNRPVFQHWLSTELSAGPKLLWVNGPAGFGKTILCAHVVERLSSTLDTPVAHFFFTSDHESREDPFSALRLWISQIVSHREGAFEHVRQKWESDSDPVATRSTVISLFTQLLHAIPGCTFVADGLDECTSLGNTNTSVAKFLHDITNAVAGTNTRLLVVSRDKPEIRRALINDASESFAEYKIMPEDVRSDTAAYSQSIVDRKLPNKSDDMRSTLSEAMTNRCQGQFLWLRMQEESLRRGMNKKQLQSAIENTPTGLDHLYDRDWTRITRLREWEKHRAFALLRWTAFALRPLTICEITEAVLIVEFEDLPLDELPDAVDDDYVDSEIIGLCGPLLEIKNDPTDPFVGRRTLHLQHFTVREFLLRQLPTPDWIQQNNRLQSSYEKVQNTVLAKACLQYVSLRQVWGDGSYDPSLGLSLRSYAATAWHRHIHLGVRNEAEIAKLCIKFLDLDNPNWEAWRSLIEPQKVGRGDKEFEVIPPGPLYFAIKLHLNDVAIALATEQSANESSSLGRSPLGVACANGCIDVVDLLLKKGANPAVTNRNGRIPLHAASYNGHERIVDLLLDYGCSADLRDKEGRTPLSCAAEKGHEPIVRRLLATNAVDVNARRFICPKSVFYGVWCDDKETAKVLFPVDDSPRLGCFGSLLPSVKSGDISLADLFKALRQLKGAEVEAIKSGNTSVLIEAPNICKKVELVLARDVNITTGTTPLHLAAQNGHAMVVKTLLEARGIATQPVDESHRTPLLLAAAAGHEAVVRLLLGENGVNPTFMDGCYQTPLSLAARYGHEAVTKLLLDNGNGILQDEVRKRT
ncbi:hypothetical protein FOMG_02270 [Fusarium oxysporum f. sp. melonis 26406]|uniref:Uncharacterized protein n=1 Tax=Fusarium oxysporum f. sp. melonis 26406 TaxID=1089452 RepID=X0B128_FUSOX|nr:hypothetical protein FOMG_02270 [Fusarium oxysporum f. sp. melonis 26406]